MFKKKPQIKAQAPLRSSDRRKTAQSIITNFAYTSPSATETEASLRNLILPDGSSHAKFSTTYGPDLAPAHGTIYLGSHSSDEEDRPLWVKFERQTPELFPTVFTLWKNPTLLPLLHTHPPVIERLYEGADLMTPGLIGPPFPDGAEVGKLVGIASSERPTVPVAVGVCEIDVTGLRKTIGEKGRAVRILHWLGDEIYKLAGAVKVPDELEVPGVNEVLSVAMNRLVISPSEQKEKEKEEEREKEKEKEKEKEESSGEEEIRQLSTKEIDDAFYNAALYGFQVYSELETRENARLEFPLPSATFINMLVHPYLPPASQFPPYNLLQDVGPHPSLQLKKTSWKNLPKLLKYLQSKDLVVTKVRNGGESIVMDINWEHPEIKSFRPYKLPVPPKEDKPDDDGAAGNGGGKPGVVKIEPLYRPNGRAIKFFQEIDAGTKDFYTAADLRTLLNTYIDTNTLAQKLNRRLVNLDPLLSNTLFTTNAADTAELAKAKGAYRRDLLADRLVSACAPYYRITSPSGEQSKPKSGSPPKITIVTTKQGSKAVTRITGLEAFGIEPKTLAEELQRACGRGATARQGTGLKPGLLEVQVQGDMYEDVKRAVVTKGIPERFFTVTHHGKPR